MSQLQLKNKNITCSRTGKKLDSCSMLFKIKHVDLWNRDKHLFRSKRQFAEAISDEDEDGFKIKCGKVKESTFRGWEKQVENYKSKSICSIKSDRYRDRQGKFTSVENGLVEYIKLRNQYYKHDKLGLSWCYLKHKAVEIGKKVLTGELAKDFSASDGWVQNVLNRNNLCGVKLHGEGNEVNEEEAKIKMEDFRGKLLNVI